MTLSKTKYRLILTVYILSYYNNYLIRQDDLFEELDGRAVSAHGVRSRELSTGLDGQS
jgi:hypothetical protein